MKMTWLVTHNSSVLGVGAVYITFESVTDVSRHDGVVTGLGTSPVVHIIGEVVVVVLSRRGGVND